MAAFPRAAILWGKGKEGGSYWDSVSSVREEDEEEEEGVDR